MKFVCHSAGDATRMNTITRATGERIAGPESARAELLTVNDVAGLLSCSPRHVYRLADAGRMPRPRKLGALVRWSRAQVSEWIAGGCAPVSEPKGGVR
jgi:excisionase family DNA binding protein